MVPQPINAGGLFVVHGSKAHHDWLAYRVFMRNWIAQLAGYMTVTCPVCKRWAIDLWEPIWHRLHCPCGAVFRVNAGSIRMAKKARRRMRTRSNDDNGNGAEESVIELPLDRRSPSDKPEEYCYLITGEKKIGKTTFSIEGCEELVMQFDKAQLAYAIREVFFKSWKEFKQFLVRLEKKARSKDKFPYERIVIDGTAEWFQHCWDSVCAAAGVKHPTDANDYGKTWVRIREEFTDAVNRLLALQNLARCGLVFIAHSAFKTKTNRRGEEVEAHVPELPRYCEEVLNGKVDAWFSYDYDGDDRILTIRGNAYIGAGHRIDGHFETPDGRQIMEVYMGSSPAEARKNFLAAFRNEQDYIDIEEYREKNAPKTKKKSRLAKKKKTRTRNKGD